MIISSRQFTELENFQKNICRENLNKPFIFNNSAENNTVYEIMWKNVVEPDRPQMMLSYDACILHVG